MTLRFVDLITNESQIAARVEHSRVEIRSVDSLLGFVATSAKQAYAVFFFKIDRIHYLTLDVQGSMLDVHFFVDPIYET